MIPKASRLLVSRPLVIPFHTYSRLGHWLASANRALGISEHDASSSLKNVGMSLISLLLLLEAGTM